MKYLLIKVLVIIPFFLQSQHTVHIQSQYQQGAAVLKPRGADCFSLTPKHVVDGEKELTLTSRSALTMEAISLREFSNADLAILKVTNPPGDLCKAWPEVEDVDLILEEVIEAQLEVRRPKGTLTRFQVTIKEIEPDVITIKLSDPSEGDIVKGFSGASLFTTHEGKKVYLGMLIEIKGDLGYVYKASFINAMIETFFSAGGVSKSNNKTRVEKKLQSSSQSEEINGIRYDLLGCVKNGSKVKCDIGITSLNGEKGFALYSGWNHTRFYDKDGIEYKANEIKLGSYSNTQRIERYTLVGDVQTKGQVIFSNIPNEVSGITMMSIKTHDGQQYREWVTKNIPLDGKDNVDIFIEEGSHHEELNDIRYDLLDCKRSGSKIICDIGITSLKGERGFALYSGWNHTRFYDKDGIEYKASEIKLGTYSNTQRIERYTLVGDVQTKGQVIFSNIPNEVSGITMMSIKTHDGQQYREWVSKNIVISN